MKINSKICKKVMPLFLFILLLIVCIAPSTTVFASASSDINFPNIYQNVAYNFFETQYSVRNIEYNDFSIALEADLYSSEEDIVAKAVVIQRDDAYDYVILNLATSEIDEFVFDDETAMDKFSEKVYYTGVLNYYTKDNEIYHSLSNEESTYTQTEFNKLSNWINDKYAQLKENASKLYRSDNNPLPNPSKDGWNGFYTWSDVSSFNNSNGYSNSEWKYLDGINWNGITASGLQFMSQTTFNNRFGTDNACGPTALTNMFIWFQYKNIVNKNGYVNALRNGSAYDTFDRFRILAGHTNSGGTSRSKYEGALKNYASEQGYNYEIRTGIDTYDEFKDSIANGRPVLTSIDLSGWGGHAVITVGCERFKHEYTKNHQFLWWKWTTTETEYSNYLRVIDGWGSSNDSRFIDLKGYWDTVTGRSFIIKN